MLLKNSFMDDETRNNSTLSLLSNDYPNFMYESEPCIPAEKDMVEVKQLIWDF